MSNIWDEWLVDVTFGSLCFVPIERTGPDDDDFNIVFGMNYVADEPPSGKVIGIIHEDGQEAVEQWCRENPDAFKRLMSK